MAYLGDLLFGYRQVNNAGSALPQRSILNFKGDGVVAVDNPGTGATDVTVSGSGSGITGLVTDVVAIGPGVASAIVQGFRGRTVASTTPLDASDYVYNGSTSTWNPVLASGDVTRDNTGDFTVVGIQTFPVSTTAPTSGQVLAWNTLGFWKPTTGGGGSLPVGATGEILVADSGGDFQPVSMGGDAEIDETGAVNVIGLSGAGIGGTPPAADYLLVSLGTTNVDWAKLTNAMVDNAAAIAGTKIAPDFGAQVVTTSVKVRGGYFTVAASGTLPASGALRLAIGAQSIIEGMDDVATSKPILSLPSDFAILFGHQTSWAMEIRGSNLYMWSNSDIRFFAGSGGTEMGRCDTTNGWQFAYPVIGKASAWGSVNATATQAMGDANQTLAAAEYQCTRVITTGGITADRDLVFPAATDAQGYMKIITNNCTSGGPYGVVVKAGASGTTVTVALAKTAIVWLDSTGVTRITADT
jgi:hypothetical protein